MFSILSVPFRRSPVISLVTVNVALMLSSYAQINGVLSHSTCACLTSIVPLLPVESDV